MLVRAVCRACRSLFLTQHPLTSPALCPHCTDHPMPEQPPNTSRSKKRRHVKPARKDQDHGTRSSP